ncbi:hypothetical protein BH10CHL1_BH10CHL1_43190 [soil metagenome]
MTTFYLDSSAIVKFYITEPGSTWSRRIIESKTNVCTVCDICLPEVTAALAQMYRSKRFSRTVMMDTYQRFLTDLRQSLFVSHPVDKPTLSLAAELALRRTLKGYDAVQVAAAVLVNNKIKGEFVFITGDKKMLNAAQAEGLSTDNPFDHTDEDKQK